MYFRENYILIQGVIHETIRTLPQVWKYTDLE